MSMSFLPNPRIIQRPTDDAGCVTALAPHQGGDDYSELPMSDRVPAGHQIAGKAQPDARENSHKFLWRRAAQPVVAFWGEALVALGIVSLPFWLFPLLKSLVGWSS